MVITGTGTTVHPPVLRRPYEAVPERLLAVATTLFAHNGFDKTSVQGIVSAAGVTKGAMYHYYASKDDLLREIYQRWITRQIERLGEISRGPGTIEERLRHAVVDIVVMCIENLDDNEVFWRSMHLLDPVTRRTVRDQRREYHELFRSLVEDGQRDGVFRPDVPADLVVHYFTGSLHHFGSWYRAGGSLTPARIGEEYATLLLSSLKP